MPETIPEPERLDDLIVIVGGCGRVGLPLGIAFADRGLPVVLCDINDEAVATVNNGVMPFDEDGAQEVLDRVVANGMLRATTSPEVIAEARHVVVVIGTPVDNHLNPMQVAVLRSVDGLMDHLRDGQHLVLRSTVFPGVTALVAKAVADQGLRLDISFCPERIAEGKALEELFDLPQIISGTSDSAVEIASYLFGHLTDSVIELGVEEAELAKLFTNCWRYIKFAAANQFFTIANDHDLDYEQIRQAIRFDYPRAADLPGAGFAAGPCLHKDAAQLAAYADQRFSIGRAAIEINEGLPRYVVSRAASAHDLANMTVGVLGMAFKAESDDGRASLAYRLRTELQLVAANVLCTDPYVADDSFVSLEQVLDEADLLVVGAPHEVYKHLSPAVPVLDIWGALGPTSRI
ncbi:MAG: nucleotide sugar dehydrogenase [Actinomycetota bacterium]